MFTDPLPALCVPVLLQQRGEREQRGNAIFNEFRAGAKTHIHVRNALDGWRPAATRSSRELDAVVSPSSAKAKSMADWNRSSGFLPRHRATMRSSAAGTFGFASINSLGSSVRIAFMV